LHARQNPTVRQIEVEGDTAAAGWGPGRVHRPADVLIQVEADEAKAAERGTGVALRVAVSREGIARVETAEAGRDHDRAERGTLGGDEGVPVPGRRADVAAFPRGEGRRRTADRRSTSAARPARS